MTSTSKNKDQRDVPHKCSTSFPEYETNHKERGWAIIFNQEKFDDPEMTRSGSTRDKKNLTERFKELGFEVSAYDNLKKDEMMAKLNEAARHNHTDSDCFVCVFLSHGKEDHIHAYDDKVKIQEITAPFKGNNCQSLVGKPKIFIFQACRGDIKDQPVTGMAGGDSEEEEEIEEPPVIYTLPAGADSLMCYSVAEGYRAFRHVHEGSFYIRDLCETLKESGSFLEFTELLTLVHLKMSRRSFNRNKQIPSFTSMLTKKLYFRPKNE